MQGTYHGVYVASLDTPCTHHRLSVRLHVIDPPVRESEEAREAQFGNNPWVGGRESLRVVNPVKVRRREVRRVTPLFLREL